MDTLFLLLLAAGINSVLLNDEKVEFCRSIECVNSNKSVCGIREEGEGVRLRLFQDECELLKYGCNVDEYRAYGLINMEYCEETFSLKASVKTTQAFKSSCTVQHDCDNMKPACGISKDGNGFRVRLFSNECTMLLHNCEKNLQFNSTDSFLCDGMVPSKVTNESKKLNTLVVVDATAFYNGNINRTIENFFAATHLINMPLQEINESVLNETTRRRIVKNAGPVVIYRPWIKIPQNISEDIYHRPTLASCYHKCPTKCPNTYAPVCGVPGVKAREPSLMFQNHCYMDVAQCKMNWEDIGPTAISSAYIDSPFIFCMGEQFSRMYVLLPLIRTLQRMGRLRKKGRFRYKLRNMRFDNIVSNKVMG